MRTPVKGALAAVALFGLAACAETNMVNTWDSYFTFPKDYTAQSEAALAGVDWSTATVKEIRFLEGDMRPTIVQLKKGQPYVLRVTNTLDYTQAFAAPEFFQNTAVAELQGYSQKSPKQGYGVRLLNDIEEYDVIKAVSFPMKPMETKEVKVVPMNEGRYRYTNEAYALYVPIAGTFTASRGQLRGEIGLILVE